MKNSIQTIFIEKAASKDSEEISKIISKILREKENSAETQFLLSKHTPELIKEKIETRDFFIIRENNKIIAAGELNNDEISGLYIKSEYRNQGLGKLFLKFMEKYAMNKGITSIHLCSSEQAVKFYKNQGYSLIKKEERTYNGKKMTQRVMQKEIE